MDTQAQIQKADAFRSLHRGPKILVLPNVWDPLGARILESIGYPAVATASAAIAYSLGRHDGEVIDFDTMLDAIRRTAAAVQVPVTADFERGYAESLDQLEENVQSVIDTGIVGINIEDSLAEGGELRNVDEQCKRIASARRAADRSGVPLFINARVDVFMSRRSIPWIKRIPETIERAKAYMDAGADGIYPITAGDLETLKPIIDETGAPVNVFARKGTPSLLDLELAGVARVSLGSNVLRASATVIRDIGRDLLDYGSWDRFTEGTMSSEEIEDLL